MPRGTPCCGSSPLRVRSRIFPLPGAGLVPNAAGVQPPRIPRGDAGPLPARSSRARRLHVLCQADRPRRSGSPAALGVPNSQLLLSPLFRLEPGLRVFGLSCALMTPTQISVQGAGLPVEPAVEP